MSPAPLRVLYFTDAPICGGAERSLAHLVANLSAAIEPVVMGTEPSVVRFVADGRPGTLALDAPPVRSKRDVRGLLELRRALRVVRPDIVHLNLTSPRSCRFALAASLLPRRLTVVAVEQLPAPSATRWQRRWRRWAHARMARHVAVGVAAARLSEAHLGLAEGAITPIHNGVPEPRPRARTAVPRPRPTVGTVCRLEQQKGLDVLLRAVAPLGVDLRVVGDGPLRVELERLATTLGIRSRVTFAGWVDDPSAELGTFDVFVLASRNEGFPLSIVEAMLQRLPVVATDVGSVREAVRHGITGLLVPPEDDGALRAAISALIDDPAYAEQLGSAGRALARSSFTASAMAAAFEDLYREVLAG